MVLPQQGSEAVLSDHPSLLKPQVVECALLQTIWPPSCAFLIMYMASMPAMRMHAQAHIFLT